MRYDDSWVEAINNRFSTRNYNGRPVETEVLAALDDVCRSAIPADCVRAVLVRNSGDNVFKGIVGSYGRIRGNPAYVAFVGKSEATDVQEMIGYLGEMVILEATALGLATCWVGGMFRQGAVKSDISLTDGEQVYALTPVGYPLERDTFQEKMMRSFKKKGEHKRKPLSEITDGLPPEMWPFWAKAALEAARLAPSAMNRQPWIFTVEEDGVTLSIAGKRIPVGPTKRLDCGITMLHFELGAHSAGVALERKWLPDPQVARFTINS